MSEKSIPSTVQQLAAALATPAPMRRGSVSQRFMKCGRIKCRCHHEAEARHGPYYSLTRMEGGKTRSRYLTEEQAALVKRQIEAGLEFRKKVEAYWEACERWSDSLLSGSGEGWPEGLKKGAWEKPSRRRRSPRSQP